MSQKPLRVMYFIGEYASFAGSQKVILNLLGHLPKTEVEPLVVVPGEGRAAEVFRAAGFPVKVVEAPAELNVFGKQLLKVSALQKAWILLKSVAPYGRALAAFMREEKVDIAHFSTARGLLLGFLGPRRLGRPVVVHIQGSMAVLGRALTWASSLIPDRMILVSESLLADVPAPFRRKCVVLPACRGPKDGADSGPARAGGASRPTTVLIASSLVPFKGYHHLLRAVAALNAERGPGAAPVEFVGIGDSPDPAYAGFVTALQKELGVTNFVHKGWQAEPERFFRDADVVVLPSVERETLTIDGAPRQVVGNESAPLVLREAMAWGKPVVSTIVGGTAGMVEDGVDGFLLPPGDPAALTRALRSLVDDPALRAKMGAAGRRKSEAAEFSPARAVALLLELYRGL